MSSHIVQIKSDLWKLTWEGLSKRSDGRIESLCIWAGQRSPDVSVVTEVIFLDGIEGVEGFALFHRITREATAQIFAILKDKGLQIVADVHTHPGDWVGLSDTDREHPLEYRAGFISIVLPYFGRTDPMQEDIGMHRYEGNYQWHQMDEAEKLSALVVEE